MKKEEILANCIEEIRNGKSTIDDCVTRYPEISKELHSLLEISACLKPDEVTPTPEFKQRALSHLFEEVQPARANESRGLWSWPRLVPARILASALAVVLILGVAGGGTVYAAQSSLPGDTLYPVKTRAEDLQLALTPGVAAKANLHLKLAQRRIDEAAQEAGLNRDINDQALLTIEQQFNEAIKEINRSDDSEEIDNAISHLSSVTLNQQLEIQQIFNNTSETNKATLKQALALTRRGNLIARVAHTNHDFLDVQPSVSDEKLDGSQIQIDGTLLGIQDRNWNVGGVIISNVHFQGQPPAMGNRVKLEGVVKNNEVYLIRVEVSENSEKPTDIKGQFNGTNENGTVNIGGISVNIDVTNSTHLKPGDKVQLQSGDGMNELHVTNQEEGNQNEDSTQLTGTLNGVDVINGTVTIRSAGNQITVNIREAQIETDNGGIVRLSDLNSFIGQEIKVENLYKKDGVIFAKQVNVEEK